MVWRVAVEGRCLHTRGKPPGRRVDFRGGTQDSKIGQDAFVRKEKLERWAAGLDG